MKFLIVFFLSSIFCHDLWAQVPSVALSDKSVETLKEELKGLKKSNGKQSILYSQKLIELSLTYKNKQDWNNALQAINSAEKIMASWRKKLVKSKNASTNKPELVYPLSIQTLKIKYTIYKDQHLEREAKTVIYYNKWMDYGFQTSDYPLTRSIVKALASHFGTEAPLFKEKFEVALKKHSNRLSREHLLLDLAEMVKEEFGDYKPQHIEALYRLSIHYYNYDNIELFKKHKAAVDKYRPDSYKDKDELTVMPRFPGCEEMEGSHAEKKACADQELLKYIYTNLVIPSNFNRTGKEGMVVIAFTVTTTGAIKDTKIIRDIGHGCGDAALKIVNEMNDLPEPWTPGRKNDQLLRVKYNLPIRFYLK